MWTTTALYKRRLLKKENVILIWVYAVYAVIAEKNYLEKIQEKKFEKVEAAKMQLPKRIVLDS